MVAVTALKMAVVFGECGRKCLSGPGNTDCVVRFPGIRNTDSKSVWLNSCLFTKV
jgi:hypothetical protein